MTDEYILTLLNIPGIGRAAVNNIIKNDPIASLDYEEIIQKFVNFSEANKKIKIPNIADIKNAQIKAKQVLEISYEKNIKCINVLDNDFPEKLKNIKNPPVLLFYKGNKSIVYRDNSIAIIGTRKPTEHGKKISERLGYVYGKYGFIVISGLAKGCDENAHKGCLNVHGKSVGVLPCSLDKVYPASNKQLAKMIIEEDGCLLSEYQIGQSMFKNSMVERDRLQSALSKAVVVVETTVDGGTMHTVNFALEQGKYVIVYKHDNKYLNEEQVQGNIKLLEKQGIIKLSTEEDVDTVKQLMREEKPSNNTSSKNEQINLFNNLLYGEIL
jgi:DNA processing protein